MVNATSPFNSFTYTVKGRETNSTNSAPQQKNITPDKKNIIKGTLAGAAVVTAAFIMPHLIAPKIQERMSKLSNSLTEDEVAKVESAFVNTLKSSGLYDKGVRVTLVNAQNAADLGNKKQAKKIASELISGKNAFYSREIKQILMPEKGMRLALFHEMGHAMNDLFGKIGKTLQKYNAKGLANSLTIPIAYMAFYTPQKAPGENENKFDKAAKFIKNNAGKLTIAAFLPKLIKEGLASLKGQKAAKELLDSNLLGKVAKSNRLGFLTYTIEAVFAGLGIYLGVKVKDHIAKPKPIENN